MLLPFHERLRSIPLVCKAWASLAAPPSPLWRECKLACTATEKKGPHPLSEYPDHYHVMRLLPKHGAAVRDFRAAIWEEEAVHDFSNSFKGIVAQLPSLEKLHFSGPSAVLRSSSDLSYLQHLTSLTQISLGLTDLTTEDWWHSHSLRPLSSLTELAKLKIHVCYKNTRFDNPFAPPRLLDPALSALSRLTSLDLTSSQASQEGNDWKPGNLDALSNASCLERLLILGPGPSWIGGDSPVLGSLVPSACRIISDLDMIHDCSSDVEVSSP
ncbi:hypothetical protein WJX74_000489 [Apatococcus lobatus]|uniref:Uncharacterized protein n=1 Tax=Apatococcus lobatus TaxID=904363 RepID=A0AAW1RIJ3_9CHLO